MCDLQECPLLRDIVQSTPVSDLFFSRQNLDALQDGIRYLVWKRSDNEHLISRQDEMTLLIIMRSIYLQNAQNRPSMVFEQVRRLNAMVLDYSVQQVLGAIQAQTFYIKDISRMPMPLERSENMSRAGTRSIAANNQL